MIRFATLHSVGRVGRSWQYILKYFDPVDPLDPLIAEYVGSATKPDIPEDTCLVEMEDGRFHEWVLSNATYDIRSAVSACYWNGDYHIFMDMWSDIIGPDAQVCGQPFNVYKALLFLLWEQRGIGFDKRIFLECQPNYMQRRGL